ncbi:hypothetical protein [Lentzea nigeriaca]|uniref:hypothetical protein n=1 Tax=Lentzea nigeriaca TaxID=1128665 RepID=UPI001957B40E|nr:hypothetical protein [Lentzea nigeriaca]MBM7864286.1 membrane-associated phospholipid phosphatase [Lentzea nigeriaca]
MKQAGQRDRAARLKVRCLATVYLIVAVIHSVLAVVERVAWPVVVAGAFVVAALALERLLARDRPACDAARRILRMGFAELPHHTMTCGLARDIT